MREMTKDLLESFRTRRENYMPRTEVAMRKLAAETVRSRRSRWGKVFTASHEAGGWNAREHMIIFQIDSRVKAELAKKNVN